jgi:hypothetical protein
MLRQRLSLTRFALPQLDQPRVRSQYAAEALL